jgi:hypothetical protein
MTLLLRRSCALLVMLLTLTPVLVGAAEAGKARPVAWLALRSYQRLEQRLREISTMAKTPGLADMMLGMVQLQLAGLGGLDRQRPIGVVVPTVSVSDKPPLAVVVPYTERDAMLQTLRSFFPQTIVENGEKLSLQGGPMPAFGQVDAQASVLIVSTTPEAVQGFDVTLPADLFGTQEGGPDVVLRVDVEAVKQQLDVAWKSMLAGMEQFWQAALQKAAEKQGLSSTDKEAMTASVALAQKGMRQFLDDLLLGENRLTFAPTGWVFDLEMRMRPASASAAFVNAQAGHMSRTAQFFTPGALLHFVENLRMTDTLRQEMLALLPASRHMLEAKLAAMPALSQEQRDAGMQAIATYLKLAEQWYAQKEIELAVEVRMQESAGPEVTGWGPFPASASAVQMLLDVVEKLPVLGATSMQVTRNAVPYQGTALHRLELPPSGSPELPHTAFLAAQGDLLAFHLGNSPVPLQGLLDRVRTAASQAPTKTDALVHLELFLAPLLQLRQSKGQMGGQDAVTQALIEKLQQGPNEPLVMDLLTRQDAATLRYAFPGALVQSVAEVMGQQITQQLRGGGEKKGSGGKSKK